jgi:predicted RNA-binding Zn-ribbon protein involved in translation (DUF1610 family)
MMETNHNFDEIAVATEEPSNEFEHFSGLTCPECGSNKALRVEGVTIEDLGDDSIQVGTDFHCVDCGWEWTELGSELIER